MRGEDFYSEAYEHLNSEYRDENLWARCLAHHEMDMQRASASYIKEMAKLIEQQEINRALEQEEREAYMAMIRERDEQDIEYEVELLEKEQSTLVFVKPFYGLALFSLLGYLRALYIESGTFVTVILIVLMGILGACTFTILRRILVPEYRPQNENDGIPTLILLFPAGISALILYFFIW